MGKTLRGLAAALFAAALGIGAAAPAGAVPNATIDDITLDGCDIVVTFTVEDAGEYHVFVWDDGELIGDVPVAAEAGASVQGRYRLTAVVKQGASGLGIDVGNAEVDSFDGVDPYNGADHVIDFCAAQSTSTTVETTDTTLPPEEPPAEVAPAATPVSNDPDYTG